MVSATVCWAAKTIVLFKNDKLLHSTRHSGKKDTCRYTESWQHLPFSIHPDLCFKKAGEFILKGTEKLYVQYLTVSQFVQ